MTMELQLITVVKSFITLGPGLKPLTSERWVKCSTTALTPFYLLMMKIGNFEKSWFYFYNDADWMEVIKLKPPVKWDY